MNDIDFDELDRAVSSLMGGATTARDDDAPKAKTLNINTTLKPGEGPSYTKLDEVAKKIGSETLVVDDATTVKDLGEISHSEPQSIAVNETAAPVEGEAPKEEQPAVNAIPGATRPNSGRFMDVVHPSSDMKSATVSSSPQVSPTQTAVAPPLAQAKATPTPAIEVTSPFITDAKVEKRPLGDPSADPVPQIRQLSESDIQQNDSPEEIVAINSEAISRKEASKDAQAVLDATKIDDPTSALDQQLQAIESIHADTISPPADSVLTVESADTGNATQLSSQGNQAQGAIYDVKEYHQPLSHPTKHKSGWGVVVIIVIIIILAAAVGAGAFFLLGLGN